MLLEIKNFQARIRLVFWEAKARLGSPDKKLGSARQKVGSGASLVEIVV